MKRIRNLAVALFIIAAVAICLAPRKAEVTQPAVTKAAGFPAKEIKLADGSTVYEFTIELNPRIAAQGAPRPVATLGMKIPGVNK